MNKVDAALNWVKKYWYLFLVAGSGLAVVIAGIFFRGRSKALVDAFMKNREGMLEQVKKIDQLSQTSDKKKTKAIAEHTQERDELDKAHEQKLDSVEKQKQERADELANRETEELAAALKKGFDL